MCKLRRNLDKISDQQKRYAAILSRKSPKNKNYTTNEQMRELHRDIIQYKRKNKTSHASSTVTTEPTIHSSSIIPIAIIGTVLGTSYAFYSQSRANTRRLRRQRQRFNFSQTASNNTKTFKTHMRNKHLKTFKPYFGKKIAMHIANALASVDIKTSMK